MLCMFDVGIIVSVLKILRITLNRVAMLLLQHQMIHLDDRLG